MTKVLIAAPARQKPEIFKEHEHSLDELIIPPGVDVDRFYVVNDCPEILPLIRCEYVICNTCDIYGDHRWSEQNMAKMHRLRQMTVQRALDGGYDYLFSVDTDLILQPRTLETLLQADKDIVSEIFYTDNWCNAWLYDQYSPPMPEWRAPGLYRCGMTGACMLVKRSVLEKGVDYRRIPNIQQALWGEDRHFSVRAACHNIDMWVDTHYPATHLYRAEDYQAYMVQKGSK